MTKFRSKVTRKGKIILHYSFRKLSVESCKSDKNLTFKRRKFSKLDKSKKIGTMKSNSKLNELKLKSQKGREDVKVHLKSLYSEGLETFIKKAPLTMRSYKSVRNDKKCNSKSAKRSQYTFGS